MNMFERLVFCLQPPTSDRYLYRSVVLLLFSYKLAFLLYLSWMFSTLPHLTDMFPNLLQLTWLAVYSAEELGTGRWKLTQLL